MASASVGFDFIAWSLRYGPFIKGLDFLSCCRSGLGFLSRPARGERPDVRHASPERYRGQGRAEPFDGRGGLLGQIATGRDRVDTTAAVVPASRPTSRLAGIAARSTAEGRHGTKTRSATRAASTAPPASRGAMSITASVAPALAGPCPARAPGGGDGRGITGGRSSPRRSPQTPALPWGSRSMTTAWPAASLVGDARATASVVLPLPPFWETSAIVLNMLNIIAIIQALSDRASTGFEPFGV